MDLLSLLESRLAERRSYVAGFDLSGHLREHIDLLRRRYGNVLEGRKPLQLKDRVEVCDICVRGDGTHEAVARKLGLELPADFLAFSRAFSSYAIIGRNGVEIRNGKDVEDLTIGLRDGEEIAGSFEPHEEIHAGTPHRLYRFAGIFGMPFHFMFRWYADGTFRDVAFACYEETREGDLLGQGSEFYSCDRSFTEWLERMFLTDAAPLHPLIDLLDGNHGVANEVRRV
ncbi:MAG: hypothetical protein EOP87_25520 [Verrucomicrobiaceae bacterium]|nr:MAG: hypothetical protein EOP87_25520 [Verrucomicrobiaceae bacterium]